LGEFGAAQLEDYLEGIMSERRDFPLPLRAVKCWIKVKNAASPAMLRIEEDGAW
jgi:hypothetical protein